jgi:hypothetical protein
MSSIRRCMTTGTQDLVASMDKSKIIYCCTKCNTLPCVCVRDSSRIVFNIIKCYEQGCEYSCYAMTELHNHHLAMHERPFAFQVDVSATRKQVNGTQHEY